MSGEDEDLETLKEFIERKVNPLHATVFALVLVASVLGSTIFLRSHFGWPTRDIPAAGLLATKDFVLVFAIVSVFELKVKQMRHPIRYGFNAGAIYFCVTFIYWAFFS